MQGQQCEGQLLSSICEQPIMFYKPLINTWLPMLVHLATLPVNLEGWTHLGMSIIITVDLLSPKYPGIPGMSHGVPYISESHESHNTKYPGIPGMSHCAPYIIK